MYIVVSTDLRLPEDIAQGFQVEQWTPTEFFTRASDEDGLELDEGIWYDVADLTAEIYEGLAAYVEAGVNIIYYRFDDRPAPNFTITQEVKVYSTYVPEPEPEEEPIPEPIVQTHVQPQIQPMPQVQPAPQYNPQQYQQPQPSYPQQPYVAPQPQVQQPIYTQPVAPTPVATPSPQAVQNLTEP